MCAISAVIIRHRWLDGLLLCPGHCLYTFSDRINSHVLPIKLRLQAGGHQLWFDLASGWLRSASLPITHCARMNIFRAFIPHMWRELGHSYKSNLTTTPGYVTGNDDDLFSHIIMVEWFVYVFTDNLFFPDNHHSTLPTKSLLKYLTLKQTCEELFVNDRI